MKEEEIGDRLLENVINYARDIHRRSEKGFFTMMIISLTTSFASLNVYLSPKSNPKLLLALKILAIFFALSCFFYLILMIKSSKVVDECYKAKRRFLEDLAKKKK